VREARERQNRKRQAVRERGEDMEKIRNAEFGM
jgi:hypothetical protein